MGWLKAARVECGPLWLMAWRRLVGCFGSQCGLCLLGARDRAGPWTYHLTKIVTWRRAGGDVVICLMRAGGSWTLQCQLQARAGRSSKTATRGCQVVSGQLPVWLPRIEAVQLAN